MNWNQKVFNYCERGLDPAFWAEPVNALSNAAIFAAAIFAAIRLKQGGGRQTAAPAAALIALVAFIGAGSLAFHCLATKWAKMADVGPISLFMLAYLAFALRYFLGLGRAACAAGVAAFAAVSLAASDLTCGDAPCLNGSVGYIPALLALIVVGALLWRLDRPKALTLITAAGIFVPSMIFRTIDLAVCEITAFSGHRLGTHGLWHLLNGIVLYLLLRAAVDHAGLAARSQRRATAEIASRAASSHK